MGDSARLKRTLRCHKRTKPCSFFSIAIVLLFSFLIFQAKGDVETGAVDANPATLFETPGELKVTFQIGSPTDLSYLGSDFLSKVDFQLGETVYMKLIAEFYRGGDFPLIANNTIFVVSDDAGTAIWNASLCQLGGGMFGCQYFVVKWTPENVGNYSAGVLFEETDYPNDFSKVLSFSVLPPSSPSDTAQTESTNPDESIPVIPVGAFASFAVIALAGAGLPIYFKKRKCTA